MMMQPYARWLLLAVLITFSCVLVQARVTKSATLRNRHHAHTAAAASTSHNGHGRLRLKFNGGEWDTLRAHYTANGAKPQFPYDHNCAEWVTRDSIWTSVPQHQALYDACISKDEKRKDALRRGLICVVAAVIDNGEVQFSLGIILEQLIQAGSKPEVQEIPGDKTIKPFSAKCRHLIFIGYCPYSLPDAHRGSVLHVCFSADIQRPEMSWRRWVSRRISTRNCTS